MSQAKTAVVVGPVYVDLAAADVGIPGTEVHAKLRPHGDRGWEREVGGSAWKFAQYWAEHYGRALFVTSVAVPVVNRGAAQPDVDRVFVDDGRWLRRELSHATPANLDVHVLEAPSGSTDYTFHIRTEDNQPGPLVSLVNGSMDQLTFSSIGEGLRRFGWSEPPDLLVSSGITRTRKLRIAPRSERPKLLRDVKICIDLGRTDIQVREDGQGLFDSLRHRLDDLFAICVDLRTADLLGWLEGNSSAPEWLIVRPGIASHDWWFLRKGSNRNLGGHALDVGRLSRPEATATSLHRLLVNPESVASHGKPVSPERTLRTPAEITSDRVFLKRLEFLHWKLLHDSKLKTILLVGETGSGKEVVAEWVHRTHPLRQSRAFVPVACGKLDKESAMLESELFGHVQGAFTSAVRSRAGAFKEADHGVILIDDLDALPLTTQSKLLRVLEDGEVRPLGASVDETMDVDVLVVVTTNVNPLQLVRTERLREDLFYRLTQGVYLEIPPLRDRRNDAVRIAQRFWNDRNLWTNTDHEMPAVLQRWVRASDLRGNTRLVAAAINDIHDFMRFSGSRDGIAEHFQEWLQTFDPDFREIFSDHPGDVSGCPAEECSLFDAIRTVMGDRLPNGDEERVVRFAASWQGIPLDQRVGIRLKAADIRVFLRLRSSFGKVRTNLLKREDTTTADVHVLNQLECSGIGAGARWLLRGDE